MPEKLTQVKKVTLLSVKKFKKVQKVTFQKLKSQGSNFRKAPMPYISKLFRQPYYRLRSYGPTRQALTEIPIPKAPTKLT